jgi:tetratricopeptide (TPR) repeat protein
MRGLSAQNKFSDYLQGMEFLKKKDFEAALAFFQKAVALNPQFPLAHHYLGETYFAVSEFDEAENSFLKASEMNPHFPLTLLYLGKIAEIKGDANKKKELFEKVFSQKRGASQELRQLAETLIKLGETENPAFLDLYLEAHRLNPDDFEIYLEIAEIFPPDPRIFAEFGAQLIKSRKTGRAIFYLYLAAYLQPQKAENWRNLGRAWRRLGDTESARICRERAEKIS